MNTEELIVMGVLMILAGGLMVARHFVHTMEIPAPMATRKARKTTGNATSPAAVQKALAVGDQQMDQMLARIVKLEERHERMVQDYKDLIAAFSVAPARLAGLEERHERMVQNYEDLIATFKEREAAMENRLHNLEEHVAIMVTGFRD